MQKITIEVKDNYTDNIMEILHGLKGVMVEKIKLDDRYSQSMDSDFMKLQIDSMTPTWDNTEDEAWDAV